MDLLEFARLGGAFIAGLLSGYSLKVVIDRSSSRRNTRVSQTGNTVGRDLVGGDVNKK